MHKIQYKNWKNIQKFAIKIHNIKSKIENLKIIINKVITIQV